MFYDKRLVSAAMQLIPVSSFRLAICPLLTVLFLALLRGAPENFSQGLAVQGNSRPVQTAPQNRQSRTNPLPRSKISCYAFYAQLPDAESGCAPGLDVPPAFLSVLGQTRGRFVQTQRERIPEQTADLPLALSAQVDGTQNSLLQ